MRHHYSPNRRIGQKFQKRKTLQKRLEDSGVSGIIGDIDEVGARRILQSKKPASEKRLILSSLENFYKKQQEWLKEQRDWRPIRRDIERGQTADRKHEAIVKQMARREAKRIFAAKPYDPHKTERSRVKYK
jgi:hypothetical protein